VLSVPPVLSRRLQALFTYIPYGRVLADIGTDHAYLPIYAYLQGRIPAALACDINPGPLEKAAQHIHRYGLGAYIQTRLGNGLAPLLPGEAQCVVIAGMGGMLMVDILAQSLAVLASLERIVLQPQHDVPAVRRALHGHGFCITDEEMLQEGPRYYNILCAEKGAEPPYSDAEYAFGRPLIQRKCPVLHAYSQETLHRLQTKFAATEAPALGEKIADLLQLLAVYPEEK